MAKVAMNIKKWNTLPDDLKILLEAKVKEFSRSLVARSRAEDEKMAQQAKSLDIKLIAWSVEERRKFRGVAREVWSEYAARSPVAKKINESQVAFLKKVGLLD